MIIKENTREKVSGAGEVYRILSAILSAESEIDRDKEHFWIIGLSVKNAVKFIDLVSLGTLSNSLVHPREVFRLAVNRGVASIIAGHNHPSGDPIPSQDDLAVTRKLRDAGEILGIILLDHVVIGDGSFVSMLEKGYL